MLNIQLCAVPCRAPARRKGRLGVRACLAVTSGSFASVARNQLSCKYDMSEDIHARANERRDAPQNVVELRGAAHSGTHQDLLNRSHRFWDTEARCSLVGQWRQCSAQHCYGAKNSCRLQIALQSCRGKCCFYLA